MNDVARHVESILFIAARPLTADKLAEYTGHGVGEVREALGFLIDKYQGGSGIQLNRIGQSFQLATVAGSAGIVQRYLEEEEKKELTKPSLETLTIIAYRGPITKYELELIRGVHCGLILRNLLVRGLIESIEEKASGRILYQVTFDFLHYLGIRDTKELPEFERLSSDEHLKRVLETEGGEKTPLETMAGKDVRPTAPAEHGQAEEAERDEDDDDENEDDDEVEKDG